MRNDTIRVMAGVWWEASRRLGRDDCIGVDCDQERGESHSKEAAGL